jgi:hypothetical protein
MRLALFTPGAYIWPVHRSFEAFLASLAMPACDAADIISSPAYPAVIQADSPPQGLPPRLDERLIRLHRELYDAMLRPLSSFRREQRGFTECFWADLQGTAFDALLNAFLYYFLRREAAGMPVVTGLSVFRTVFFNHEAAEPAHWLYTAEQRLAAERDQAPVFSAVFRAPMHTRVQDLAFVINSALDRSPSGPGWITGKITRGLDGLCLVRCECGIDAGALSAGEAWQKGYREEIRRSVARVFGWDGLVSQEAAA